MKYFIIFLLLTGPKVFATECTDFSGVYFSDNKRAWERCIEIRQPDCSGYKYFWYGEGGYVDMDVITDGIYRTYSQQPSTMKAFAHKKNGSLSFKFYKIHSPEKVSEDIKTMLQDGNIESNFYPNINDTSNAIKATLHRMKSVRQCLDELAKEW